MNWLYALLFFLFLFIAKERSSIWGEGITRIKFWIGRIIPNLPIISQLKSKLFFVRILSTTWDAQFQFSYSALSSTSRIFFPISYSSTSRAHSFFIFHFFHLELLHFFIALLLFQLSPQTEWRSTIFKVRRPRSTICNFRLRNIYENEKKNTKTLGRIICVGR